MQRKTQTVPRKEKAAYCKVQMSEQKELQDLKATKFGETSTDMIFALTEALKCRELPSETVTLIRAVLEKAGIKPCEGIVVENAPLGVRAAVAAGIFTIAVNTGPLPDEALTSEGANLVFAKMTDLRDAWEVLLSEARKI